MRTKGVRQVASTFGGVPLLSGLKALEPLPAPEHLVSGLIRKGSVNLLVGYGSSGKTWFASDLLLAVARGKPWFGKFDTKQGKTLFLDWESGRYELCRRVQALARGKNADAFARNFRLCFVEGFMLGTEKAREELLAIATGRSLIIIDSLRAASNIDENDSRVRYILDQLRGVAEKTGCSFLVLHHAGKGKSKGNANSPARERPRGSSAIFDAADTVFDVDFANGTAKFTITKYRHGPTPVPFSVRIADGKGGVTVKWTDQEELDQAEKLSQFEDLKTAVLYVIHADPGCNKSTVEEQVESRGVSTRKAIASLIDENLVVDRGNKKSSKLFLHDDETMTTHKKRNAQGKK